MWCWANVNLLKAKNAPRRVNTKHAITGGKRRTFRASHWKKIMGAIVTGARVHGTQKFVRRRNAWARPATFGSRNMACRAMSSETITNANAPVANARM